MLDSMMARDEAANGRFLVGVLTTGIYCLPSCPARKPKPANVRFLRTEEEAREAGLRPCLRCRPNDFYRGVDVEEERAEELMRAVADEPAEFADVASLSRAAGVGSSKLHELFRRYFHSTPARELGRARIARSADLLLATERSVAEIAFDAGFESLSSFNDNFVRTMAMAPAAYRKLPGSAELDLRLPRSYPLAESLRYLGRSEAAGVEKVEDRTLAAGVWLAGSPARLTIDLEPGSARCRIDSAGELDGEAAVEAHRLALNYLGLGSDVAPFTRSLSREGEEAWRRELPRRFRLWRTGDPFSCLLWVLVGQQIGFGFACKLLRQLTELAGESLGGGLSAPARPETVAELTPRRLMHRQFSRSKAEYVTDLARRVVSGHLDLNGGRATSVTRRRRALLAERGIGPWSADYLLMRGYGFEDCLPHGDAGLRQALVSVRGMDHPPASREIDELMAGFAPYRSFATFSLWQTLGGT